MAKYPKAKFAEWYHVDPLTLAQAAALWEGVEPFPKHEVPQGPIYTRQTRLKNWLTKHGKIPPGHVKAKAAQGVCRACLMQIAQEWGERPPFLYSGKARPSNGATTSRHANPEKEAKLRGRIKRVLDDAKEYSTTSTGVGIGLDAIARRLVKNKGVKGKFEGFGVEAISQIVEGKYQPMRRRGIKSPYSKGNDK